MPYASMDDVNPAIKGIKPPVTLDQANTIASWADRLEEEGEVENPWAVAIAQFKKSYHVEDGKWVRNEAETAQMGELIPLAEFAEVGDVISVQIMRPGQFQEMHGRWVTITDEDLEEYVANFEAGAVGQELPVFVGHPPPAVRPQEPAAAWYKRLYTKAAEGAKTLWADIELTALGMQVLSEKLYKYLSPSVDLARKVITGGGFVNLPAIKGQPAIELSQFLRGAEMMEFSEFIQKVWEFFGLAEFATKTEDGKEYPARCYLSVPDSDSPSSWGLRICEYVAGKPTVTVPQLGRAASALGPGFRGQRYQTKPGESRDALKRKLVAAYRRQGVEKEDIPEYLFSEGGMDMTEEELAQLRAQIKEELEAEFTQRQQEQAELAESIRQELREELEVEFTERAERQAELAEFAESVTSGEAGLSTPPEEIVAFLADLDEEQLEEAKKLLQAKVVDFSEKGHTGAGGNRKKELPEAMVTALKAYIYGRSDVAEAVATFCEANDLDPAEFDFSEFVPE